MGDSLSWTLKLNDQISGPATAAKGALGGVDDALTKVQGRGGNGQFLPVPKGLDALAEKAKAAEAGLTSVFGPELTGGLMSIIGGFQEMDGVLKGLGTSLGGIAGAAASAGLALAALAIGGLAAGAKLAIDASEFKKNTLAGLESILGSKDAAAGVYKQIKAFADTSPFETQQVATLFKGLLGAGVSANDTEKILKGIFDVSALQGFDTQVADSLTRTIGKIEGLGKLTGEALTQISEQSGGTVSRSKILDQLVKSTGKSLDEVNKLLAAGKIDAKQGVDAILEAIRTGVSGGELGALSGKLGAQSFTGLASTLKSKLTGTFEDVDISPLTGAMGNLVKVLDGPVGAKLKSTAERVFGGLFKTLFEGLTPERIESAFIIIGAALDTIESKASGLVTGFRAISTVVGALAPAFTAAFGPLDDLLGALGSKSSASSILASAAFASIGDAIIQTFGGPVIGAISSFGQLLDGIAPYWDKFKSAASSAGSSVGSALSDMWSSAGATLSSFASSLYSMGADMIAGLVNGILAGAAAVADALTSVIDQGIAAANKLLGRNSPAKATMEMGDDTAEGYAIGVASNDNAVSAMRDLVSLPPASVAAAAGTAAGARAASGGAAGGGKVYYITINAPGGDARAIRDELADLLDELDATGTG